MYPVICFDIVAFLVCFLAQVPSLVTAQTQPLQLPPLSLDSGLVAYYPFDGDASDHSGNGNHGCVHGAHLTSDRFGNPRSAYIFENPNDTISAPGSSDFDFSDERAATLSCWICGSNIAGEANIELCCSGGHSGTGCKLFRFG